MIRPATLDDLPALLALAGVMHAEAPAYRDWQFDADKVAALLRGLIAGGGCLLVSVMDDEIAGGIAGLCTEHWFSREKVATDLALFVAPQRRHGTTAMRLVLGFMAWAELVGARRVNLGITTGVHPGATGALYELCGLRDTGRLYSKDF